MITAATVAALTDAKDVVFIGGTGTGWLPHNGVVAVGFTAPFVDLVDDTKSVLYDGSPWARPAKAVPAVLQALASMDDDTVVIGLSKGAQVARTVERLDPNPATRYVLIGDPDSRTGLSRRLGWSPDYQTPTHTTDVVFAEYDGFADFPDKPWNLIALANAALGAALVHPHYGDRTQRDPLTRIFDATTTVETNGNGTTTTTRILPTPLPLAMGATWLDTILRPLVNTAHTREKEPQ